ncbi:hypothetical protein SAMN04488136_11669 [Vibrio xiamenensis]|uniref:Uncharacterized protein n=1 Tax=Vibrio xiamenensis TaxID=861298 RepID=A0A1G8CHE0_9VIBR|nr:hypothetical protein [Vibrio xiamenensis]SDH44855.1 hypothetical protein SAMN04488136_11669 [Vibrio xiamenensis]
MTEPYDKEASANETVLDELMDHSHPEDSESILDSYETPKHSRKTLLAKKVGKVLGILTLTCGLGAGAIYFSGSIISWATSLASSTGSKNTVEPIYVEYDQLQEMISGITAKQSQQINELSAKLSSYVTVDSLNSALSAYSTSMTTKLDQEINSVESRIEQNIDTKIHQTRREFLNKLSQLDDVYVKPSELAAAVSQMESDLERFKKSFSAESNSILPTVTLPSEKPKTKTTLRITEKVDTPEKKPRVSNPPAEKAVFSVDGYQLYTIVKIGDSYIANVSGNGTMSYLTVGDKLTRDSSWYIKSIEETKNGALPNSVRLENINGDSLILRSSS